MASSGVDQGAAVGIGARLYRPGAGDGSRVAGRLRVNGYPARLLVWELGDGPAPADATDVGGGLAVAIRMD